MITWDLNLWFKESVVDDEVVMDDVITINPAIYLTDENDTIYGGVRKVYTGILYKCTPEETAKIRAFRSEEEYGTDWWDFADELHALDISRGIQHFLEELPEASDVNLDDNGDLYYVTSMQELQDLVG